MVWDLRGALLKKQEVETARLADFEFRLRARTMRLLEEALALKAGSLVERIAEKDDAAILASLAETGADPSAEKAYQAAQAEARRQLIAELGDPTPHRLA